MLLEIFSDKEKEILKLIMEDNGITVSQISQKIGLSVVAVRSHLDKLAKKGILIRNHGGAVLTFHPEIMARQEDRIDEKNRIAKAAVELIHDGDTIMINSSTTGTLIAKYLMGRRNIRIVTNSTLILPYARMNPLLRVNFIGGDFRPETEAMVGPLAIQELENFHARLAFIGTAGFSLTGGVTAHLSDEADVVRMFAKQSDTTILVADSSKYGQIGYVRFLKMSEIQKVITDTGLSDASAAELTETGIEVLRV
jgi:DeoR family galactitol utilization operon repressor